MQIALESDGDDDNAWGFPDDDRVVESDSDTSVIAAMEKELFTPTQGEKSAGPVDMTDPLLLHLQALGKPLPGDDSRNAWGSDADDSAKEGDAVPDPSPNTKRKRWEGFKLTPTSSEDRSSSPRRPAAESQRHVATLEQPARSLIREPSPLRITHRVERPTVGKAAPSFSGGIGWWATKLWTIVNSLRPWSLPNRPMVAESACSGLLGEIAVSKVLSLWVRWLSGCDPKVEAQKFCVANFAKECEHFFKSLEATALRSGECFVHGMRNCEAHDDQDLDCFFVGTPCQPWSAARDKSQTGAKTSGPFEHPDWAVTFEGYFRAVDVRRPKGGVCEQTMAFFQRPTIKWKSQNYLEGHKSPGDLFMAMLRKRGYCVSKEKISAGVWAEVPRDRRLGRIAFSQFSSST
jgi:hypothetical protein